MGRKSGILLIVAGALLLAPCLCLPLYVYAHHYYTIGLSISPSGYLMLGGWLATSLGMLITGSRIIMKAP
jgi:hypothetical protein